MHKLLSFAFFLTLATGLTLGQAGKSSATGMPPVPKVTSLPPAAEQAMAAVNPENIRWHVKFLADDLLEGRGTGQRGGDIAAEYIATQFALYGLKPAGDNGSYLQKVPMVGIMTLPDSTFSLIPAKGEPIDPAQSRRHCRHGRDRPDLHHHRRTDCVDGLRHRRPGVQLERLQGR